MYSLALGPSPLPEALEQEERFGHDERRRPARAVVGEPKRAG
jgi:hypothetical protein